MIDPEKTHLAVPAHKTDQIIGVIEDSITVPTHTSPEKTHSTGFGDTCYFNGVFFFQNGWNDLGDIRPDFSNPSFPILNTATVDVEIDPDGTVRVTGNNRTGSTVDLPYRIFLLAKNNQGPINPLPVPTNSKSYYWSKYNFMKIYRQDQVPFDLAGDGSGRIEIINHPLGYIPRVQAWYQQTSSPNRMVPLYSIGAEISLFDSAVVFFVRGVWDSTPQNGRIEYRIYLDR